MTEELYEWQVWYHVLGVKTYTNVVAPDEILAWEIVEKTLTTREYWLENVIMLRRYID
jgi:hypothetical protein